MVDPLYLLAGVNVLLGGAVLYLAIAIRKQKQFIGRLSIEKGKVVDAQLLELWRYRMSKEPEGSPKWRAYKANLKRYGD